VKKSGTPETLSYMNSKERWVVHNYLRDVPGVTSVSEGEGAEKRLKIIPE
jgi:predicted RNA-binding protein Jag